MYFPAAIELNDLPFRLFVSPDVSAYEEFAEPKLAQENEVAGSSRPSQNARNDILPWRQDDWSGGEGQLVIDPSDDDSFKRYLWNETGAVNVLTPGQIELGLSTVQSDTIAAVAHGPFLVPTRHDGTANPRPVGYLANQVLVTMAALDTWTNRGSVAAAAGNQIRGAPAAYGGYIFATYIDGTSGAGTSRVRRIRWDGSVLTQADFTSDPNTERAVVSDQRLHVWKPGTDLLQLRRTPLTGTLPLAPETVMTADGVASLGAASALGSRIFFATMDRAANADFGGEDAHVHTWDGSKGFDRVTLPEGFKIDGYPYDSARFLGDIFYISGVMLDTNGTQHGQLAYVAPGRSGIVGTVREGSTAADAWYVGALRAQLTGPGNRLTVASGTSGKGHIFVYDVRPPGGLSQYIAPNFAGTQQITSIAYIDGRYWIGTREARQGTADDIFIHRTLRPGDVGYHPAAAKVVSAYYDFRFREETKLIHTLKVETEPLLAGTSVRFEIEDEMGNIISTDKDGADLTHNDTGATGHIFEISGVSSVSGQPVDRFGRLLRVIMYLETTATSSTPVVQSWTMETTLSGYTYFYNVVLSLEDQESGHRILGRQVSGRKQAELIRELTRFRRGRTVKFNPRWMKASGRNPYPRKGSPWWPAPVEIVDFDLRGLDEGNGFVRLKLRELVRAG